MIGRPQEACQGEINQGDFHTHPYKSLTVQEKMFLIKKYGHDRMEKELENIITKEFKEMHVKDGLKNVSINTPSYIDALKTLGFKCDGLTQGTICIGTDIEKNKVECWSVYATRLGGDMPVRKWIVSLFDKEVIEYQ